MDKSEKNTIINNVNAGEGSTDEVNSERKTLHEVSAKKGNFDKCFRDMETTDKDNANEDFTDEFGGGKESVNGYNIKTTRSHGNGCSENKSIEEKHCGLKKALYFAHNLYLYSKRQYDMSRKGTSDIKEENIHLYKILISEGNFENALECYGQINKFGEYRYIVGLENRCETLISTFKLKLKKLDYTLDYQSFMYNCTACIFTALDLQEKEGFNGAARCAVCAIVCALNDPDLDMLSTFDASFREWVPSDSTLDAFFKENKNRFERTWKLIEGQISFFSAEILFKD